MAEIFEWNYDALTGVYKNHALSNKLLEVSALDLVLAQFATPVPGFGKQSGESVSIPHYKELDTLADPTIEERDLMPVDEMQMGGRQITVKEWGRGVQFTHLSEQLSKFSPKQSAQKRLIDQMRRAQDVGAADAFKTCKIKYIPTGAGAGTWDVDGTASTVMAAGLDLAHLGAIRDYMVKDLHTPFYEGNHYVGVLSTKALRSLKNDTTLTAWKQYLQDGAHIYNSEVGKVESIRFVECSFEESLSSAVGSGTAFGEGLIFGDEALALVEAEKPHLRMDPNFQSDFGRRKACAWYGILAYGTWWDTANDREAKIVHIASS